MADLPQLLTSAWQHLTSLSQLPPNNEALDIVSAELQHGLPAQQAPPLRSMTNVIADRVWLRLSESAAHDQPQSTAVRSAGAWSSLHVCGEPAVLLIGAEAVGQTTVSIGIPPGPAVDQWLSDNAPDTIWIQAAPTGTAVLSDPRRVEYAMTCRSVPVPEDLRDRPPEGAVPALSRLFDLPLSGWCVALILDPVSKTTVQQAELGLEQMIRQANRRVNTATTLSDHDTATVRDPRAEAIIDTLQAWRRMLDDAVRFGGWRATAYIIGQDARTAAVAGGAFSATLGADAAAAPGGRLQAWDPITVSEDAAPAYGWLSSTDIGAALVPPRESAGTLQVRRPLPGGRLTVPTARPIRLGSWLGTRLPAEIDVDDLAGHAFVAGITGSGKSTTTASLVTQLWNDHRVPFLVIDPAKADYAELAYKIRGGLRIVSGADLRMNVLAAWPGRPVDRHIALMGTAFRGSFGMPIPVPYVVSLLLEELTAEAIAGRRVTLHDVAARLESLIVELGYAGEIADNIRASLGLRLRMLLQPSRAERVAGAGAPTWLTDRPTLVQLNDLGDEEERAFLASMLVLYVSDAARAGGAATSVRHVTVIEEAHRLMPEPVQVNAEIGDAASVASKLFTQLLAEVRAYGESVVVVDQSPAAVAREVLRNTNLKLAHRIVDPRDQESLGGSIGLAEDERDTLGSLAVGRCLMSSRSLLRPQPVAVDRRRDPDLVRELPALPADPPSECHSGPESRFHHTSEQHVRTAELYAALWSVNPVPGPTLAAMMQQIVRDDSRTRVSCLMNIGIRRHVATLDRLGQLGDRDPAQLRSQLWQAALGQRERPAHPAAEVRRPFAACEPCKRPCIGRSAVESGGLARRTQLRADALQAPSAEQAAAEITMAIEDTMHELDWVSTPIANTVGYCLGATTAHETGYERALVTFFNQ